jgi:tripartite-type tricarboxylate transporter receptor subunit TctC
MLGTQAFLGRATTIRCCSRRTAFTVMPLLRAKVPYDDRRRAPISLAVDFLCVAVSRTLEVGSLSDFVKLAREKPTGLNFYAAPGAPYLAYLAFQKRAAIETTFVAYNSPYSAILDLSEGRIHIAATGIALLLPQTKAGRTRLIAVNNRERSPAAADVPRWRRRAASLHSAASWVCSGRRDMQADLRERIAADAHAILKAGLKRPCKCWTDRAATPSSSQVLSMPTNKWSTIARDHNISRNRTETNGAAASQVARRCAT